MRFHVVKWAGCGMLALLVGATSFSADKDDEKKAIAAAQAAILEVVAGKGDPKEVATKHELESVMAVYKLRSKGGYGYGPVPMPGKDGIEAKLGELSKQPMKADDIKKEAADLAKMIAITKAVGDISAYYPDTAKKAPAKWKKYNEDLAKSSKDIEDAIKNNDPKKLKAAVGKLSTACNDCHTDFK